MKSFLFLVSVIAFYLGVNYFSFTEGAVQRWAKKSQFPDEESTALFCNMLQAETIINFNYTINSRSTKTIEPNSSSLCNYYKQNIIPGAKPHTVRVHTKVISHQHSEELPFNKGKSQIEISIIKDKLKINRKIDIELKRNLLGDFTILSIKGHDQITQEEKPRRRY